MGNTGKIHSVKPPTPLSAKQSAFAASYAQHHNASLAAREASYSVGCASVTGARLLVNASVLARIQAYEADAALALGISRQRLLNELQHAAALAQSKGEPMALIAAWREIGKVCGYYQPERVAVAIKTVEMDDIASMRHMTNAELEALIEQYTVASHTG